MVPLGTKHLQLPLVIAILLFAGCTAPEDTPGATVDPTPASVTPPTPTIPMGTIPEIPTKPTPPEVAWPALDPMANISFITNNSSGLLETTLVQELGTVVLNGTPYATTLFNGALIPPVWRIDPGNTINVTLVADAPLRGGGGHDHGGDNPPYTNLHFHGLNVPPQAPGDDVFIQVYPPGGKGQTSYNYSVQLPDDHPEGLFWFHPHPHGYSDGQVIGGMSGAMIVGNVTRTYYPDVVYTEERLFLLRDFKDSTPTRGQGPTKNSLKTLNGATWSEFEIAPGETQFWRFANIGADLNFHMVLEAEDGTRVPFYVITVDGNILTETVETTDLFLYPGARFEAFVVGPPEGAYTLRSLPISRGGGLPEPMVNLSAVASRGSAPPTTPASVLQNATPAKSDPRLDVLRAYVNEFPEVNRTIEFVSIDKNTLGINGTAYNVSAFDTVIRQGTIEVWNVTSSMDVLHVFHIHQLDFLVMSVNGVPAPMLGLQDTVFIPPGTPGYVHIAIPFLEDHTVGNYVFHCHILAHEDKGMMANIQVLPRDTAQA